jgi:adenylate cyclase
VAVLPLTHRPGDAELEVLAEELTEEITRELAQSSYVQVIAAGTMAALRGKPVDYQALGRELHARYLIEGKLQRAGEDVRLTVQLIDADAVSMVWSPRFVRKVADIAASPEEFPVAVATQLGEQIVQIEMKRAMTKPGPFSGWEHLMRAEAYFSRFGADSLRSTVEEARSAIAAAPDLGLAHAMLASALGMVAKNYGEGVDDVLSREIHAHIERAIQLDGDNPTVIARLVLAYHDLDDGETGLRLARRAAQMYPNAAHARAGLGLSYFSLGRIPDAIQVLEEEDRLIPRSASLALLGVCYWLEGRPGEAEIYVDRSLALHPNWGIALKWKAVLAAHKGEEAAAHDIVRRLLKAEPPKSVDQHVRQVFRFPLLGERLAGAAAILRRLLEETGGDG